MFSGISGKSQILFLFVFVSRHFQDNFLGNYNMLLNLVFIGVTIATIFTIYFKFPHTNEILLDSFRIELLIVPAAILAGFVNNFVNSEFSFRNILWAFSIYLEALAIIPQIIFVKRTGEGERLTTTYIFVLVYYRALHNLYLVKVIL